MRWMLLTLLLIPLASAGAGHADPAVTSVLFVHHTEAGMVLHPSSPGEPVLTEGVDATPCEPVTWTAVFSLDPTDASADDLVRTADFAKVSPRLTWFLEFTDPAVELPVTVEATLRTAELVAQGNATTSTVEIADRTVVKADVALAWADRTIDGPLRLDVTATIGADACQTTPVGIRPYADADNQPRIVWDLYKPVAVDLFETAWAGDRLLIRVHASSPWGPLDLDAPAPVITTPTGSKVEAVLDTADTTGPVANTWAWDAAGALNGTYRVDTRVSNADGSNAITNFTTFQVGGDAPAPVAEPPAKKSPLPLAWLLIAIAVASRRRIS